MRCYDGCPDSEMQAHLDSIMKVVNKMKKIEPEARCVYFPMEGKHSVWVDLALITKFHDSKIAACEEAIKVLSNNQAAFQRETGRCSR